jgi:hypothetical protein
MNKFSVQDLTTGKTMLVSFRCDRESAIQLLQQRKMLGKEYSIMHYVSKEDSGTSRAFIFDDYIYDLVLDLI